MSTDPTERRVEQLETVVRALVRQVEELRADVARLRGGAPAPIPAAPPPVDDPLRTPMSVGDRHQAPRATPAATPPRRPPRPPLDIEGLVGRYGTMALGGLTILLGVGAFLGWAVSRVTLGPGARVVLGAVAALLVAALGVWLRRRGTRRFGNVLLALALAIVHVVAWGAGPALHVVPAWVALLVTTAASGALAVLAWREEEEALFAVGVGGALLAPFVTSEARGAAPQLLAYGWVVIATAVAALRDRPWTLVRRFLVLGAGSYAGVALATLGRSPRWFAEDLPALFALACALAAVALASDRHRHALARGFLLVLFLAVAGVAIDPSAVARWDLVALAAFGTVTLYVALRGVSWMPGVALSTGLLALGFLLAAQLALPAPDSFPEALVAMGWAAMAAIAARFAAPEQREQHLLVAGLSGLAAIPLLLEDRRLLAVPALAAYGAGVAHLARRLDSRTLLLPVALAFLLGGGWAFALLEARPAYAYAPFLGVASATALALVVSVWLAAREAAPLLHDPAEEARPPAIVAALGPVALFLWGREELRRAGSPDLAGFLVIAYYAATGVGLIFDGRRRGSDVERRIGLALAVFAALKAIVQASGFTGIGLRVATYLLVGAFLLGVAYWYRAGAEGADTAPESPAGAPSGGRA
jgi:uncharacterized membrane protein